MEIQDEVGRLGVSFTRALGLRRLDVVSLDVLADFNSAAAPGELVRLVMMRAVIETGSDRGLISWIDGNEMVVASCYDPFGELAPIGSRWPLAGDQVIAVARAAGRPKAAQYEELTLDAMPPSLARTYAGLKHMLVVPVRAAGEDLALLCVSRRRSEEFSVEDSDVLHAIAAAAAQPLRAARLDEHLTTAQAELSDLVVRAESVERVKTDVLRLASHELRSPLTVLHGYLSLVRDGFFGDIPEPLAGVVAILERRTQEMNTLVNDMLVAARVEDIPAESTNDVTDLREVLSQAVREVMPRATEQHRLTLNLPPDPMPASVDAERVMLALRNIIDNAVKYSPSGGDVVCEITEDAGMARMKVSDHGLGIAPEDRDKLFTRFGRVLTTANSHIPGIGLGLYFSREVARRHGGDVALMPDDGLGTAFVLSLPLVSHAHGVVSDPA